MRISDWSSDVCSSDLADIVVWDPKRSKTISAKRQQSVIDYNVFEGIEVTGLPRFTLTRGEVAVEESTVKARPGHGEFVKREPGPAPNRALSPWKEITAPRQWVRAPHTMPQRKHVG